MFTVTFIFPSSSGTGLLAKPSVERYMSALPKQGDKVSIRHESDLSTTSTYTVDDIIWDLNTAINAPQEISIQLK